MARVLFDSAHNEYLRIGKWGAANYMDVHPESMDFQELAISVAKFGFEISCIDTGVMPDNIGDYCDILVIADPEDDYFHSRPYFNKQKKCYLSQQEIDNILNFVKNGGGLLILQEKYCTSRRHNNLNELTKHFGVAFNDECLQSTKNLKGNNNHVVIDNLFEHDIVNKVENIVFFEGCSMNIDKANTNNPITIANTDKNAHPHSNTPAIVAVNCEKGKVVCIGDATIFSELGFRENTNNHKQLLWNILKWLTPQENLSKNFVITNTSDILLPIALNKIALLETQKSEDKNQINQPISSEDIIQIKEWVEQQEKNDGTRKLFDILSDIVLMVSALSLTYILGNELAQSSKIVVGLLCIAFTALAILAKILWIPKGSKKKG